MLPTRANLQANMKTYTGPVTCGGASQQIHNIQAVGFH